MTNFLKTARSPPSSSHYEPPVESPSTSSSSPSSSPRMIISAPMSKRALRVPTPAATDRIVSQSATLLGSLPLRSSRPPRLQDSPELRVEDTDMGTSTDRWESGDQERIKFFSSEVGVDGKKERRGQAGAGRTTFSMYTTENVEQLQKQEDGALASWIKNLAVSPANSSRSSLRSSPDASPSSQTPPLVSDPSLSPPSPHLLTPPGQSSHAHFPSDSIASPERDQNRFRSRFSVDPPSIHSSSSSSGCCPSPKNFFQSSRWTSPHRPPRKEPKTIPSPSRSNPSPEDVIGLGLVLTTSNQPGKNQSSRQDEIDADEPFLRSNPLPLPPFSADDLNSRPSPDGLTRSSMSEWELVDESTPTNRHGFAQKYAPPKEESNVVKKYLAPSPKVVAWKGYRDRRVPTVPRVID